MAGTETISCHCNECNILICISFNDWIEISNSYSTYARPGAFTDPGLEQVEQIREGSKNSELKGCLVKPLRCHSCKTPLGVRCVRAPVEKTANVNRSYLKLAKMTTKSITSGNFVKATVKQRQNPSWRTSSGDALASRQDVPKKPTSSKKHPKSQRIGREGEDTEALSSDQVFDPVSRPTAGSILVPDEQGRDIERITASVNILQREMVSLTKSVKFLMDRKGQASQDISRDIDVPADDTIEVCNGASELDALKLEMKMLQQRIKCMEDSRSTGRWSPTVSRFTQISRRPPSTIDEAPTLFKGAPSNGVVFSTAQTTTSACSDGGFAPQILAPERHVAVDGCNSSSYPVDFKSEAVPPKKLFSTKPRTGINGTVSRGKHGLVSMPHSQIPCKAPEQAINRRSNSYSVDMATPRTALTPIMGSTSSRSLPRTRSQRQEASTDSHHSHPESHIYDDELDDDDAVRPQSSTGSFTGNSRQPASTTAHSLQNQKNESIQRQPSKTQRRKSVSMAPPAPKASNEIKSSTSHRESKRRKTTASDANTSNASIRTAGSRELRSTGDRRGGQGLSVRIESSVDGRPAKFQKVESKGGKERG